MDFGDFERHARRAFEEIPDVYREGIDGLTVSREAPAHPELPDVYTLGECLTEDHLSDYGSPETTRSSIQLYWGSFRALSEEDPDFDWGEEIWETLTHELRHHLESLAGDDALEGIDYATDETFNRIQGRPFDPWYYQQGEDVGNGVYRVERKWYVEQLWSEAAFLEARWLRFSWDARDYRVARPAEMGDIHFVLVHGLALGDGALELVIVRSRTWLQEAKRVLGASRLVVIETEAEAEPADAGG